MTGLQGSVLAVPDKCIGQESVTRDPRTRIDYYSESRLHFSLHVDSYETPLMASGDKRASEAARKGNPDGWRRPPMRGGSAPRIAHSANTQQLRQTNDLAVDIHDA